MNFTGAGVVATAVGSDVTVTISGGGSGGTPALVKIQSWVIGAM
jgi:hypothetical protein